MMKILHFTNNDFDGAGRAVHTLHKALQERGVDSQILVYRKKSNDASVVQVCQGHPLKPIKNLIKNGLKSPTFLSKKVQWEIQRQIWQPETIFNFGMAFVGIESLKQYLTDVDVVCLHSTQLFLSPELIEDIQKYTGAPIVWTIMDVEPLSGGCHFNDGCRKFEQECGQCPQLKRSTEDDISHFNWLRKKKYLTPLPIHFIAASDWVKDYIQSSSLFESHSIHKILLSVDESIFKPGLKKDVRMQLNLPLDKDIILFGCFDVLSERKGGSYLIEALHQYTKKNSNVMIVTFGRNADMFLPKDLNVASKHFGPIHEDAKMAQLFQAADVFACPTIDDFGPLVVVECFMCGTPVVAFNQGVAQDLIIKESVGVLVDQVNVEAYAHGIERCLDNKNQKFEVDNDVEVLKEACTQEYQANQYFAFLEHLTKYKGNLNEQTLNELH